MRVTYNQAIANTEYVVNVAGDPRIAVDTVGGHALVRVGNQRITVYNDKVTINTMSSGQSRLYVMTMQDHLVAIRILTTLQELGFDVSIEVEQRISVIHKNSYFGDHQIRQVCNSLSTKDFKTEIRTAVIVSPGVVVYDNTATKIQGLNNDAWFSKKQHDATTYMPALMIEPEDVKCVFTIEELPGEILSIS